MLIKSVSRHTQLRALNLASVDRQDRRAADEARGNIGAAADGSQPQVGFHVLINPGIGLQRQGRAGGVERTQLGKFTALIGLAAILHALDQKGRATAKVRDFILVDKVPQGTVVGRGGIAIGQHHGGTGQQAANHQVPDNPASTAQEHEAVTGQHIVLQAVGLEVGQHNTAVAVHHGLGQARRPRGIHHPQRVLKRHAGELQLSRCGQRLLPAHGVAPGQGAGCVIGLEQGAGHVHHMLNLGQALQHFIKHRAAVKGFAGVAIAVGSKNQFGLDLLKAIEHHGHAHLGCAAGPDGANAGAGQKCHHGLRNIGQIGHHAVAAAHTQFAQLGCQRTHIALQLRPGDLHRLGRFTARNDGRTLGAGIAENMFGVVQLGIRKPLRARHAAIGQHLRGVAIGLNVKVIPDRAPEAVEVIDRPVPQALVVVELAAPALAEPVHVVHQTTLRHLLLAGTPQFLSLFNYHG